MKNFLKKSNNPIKAEEPINIQVIFSDEEGWQKTIETLPSGNLVERKFKSVSSMLAFLKMTQAGTNVMVSDCKLV